ncbi:MAG: type II toxin-antitoxin system RatA family toxin [Pseudomonadota bacterium]
MTTISRHAIVPYDAQKMYELVNNVVEYPEFLSGCDRVLIHQESELAMRASLFIKKMGMSFELETDNVLKPGEAIEMSLNSGPFKYLQGEWQFAQLRENACKVALHMEYRFKSKTFELMLGRVFSELANNMLQSFVRRAQQKFGVVKQG